MVPSAQTESKSSPFQARAMLAGLDEPQSEQKLWYAVLAQAFRDFCGDIPSEGPRHYREAQVAHCRRSAKAWFMSDAIQMGTFRWIADLFDLDARAVRRRLFRGPRISISYDEQTVAAGRENISPAVNVALAGNDEGATANDVAVAA